MRQCSTAFAVPAARSDGAGSHARPKLPNAQQLPLALQRQLHSGQRRLRRSDPRRQRGRRPQQVVRLCARIRRGTRCTGSRQSVDRRCGEATGCPACRAGNGRSNADALAVRRRIRRWERDDQQYARRLAQRYAGRDAGGGPIRRRPAGGQACPAIERLAQRPGCQDDWLDRQRGRGAGHHRRQDRLAGRDSRSGQRSRQFDRRAGHADATRPARARGR